MISITFSTFCFSSSWETHWIQAVEFCQQKNYTEAEKEFDLSIIALEYMEDTFHYHVYIDRARLYILENRYVEALSDLNIALDSINLKETDRIRGLVSRIITCMNLNMYDQALSDFDEYKIISPYFPKIEFTKENIIIRNMPTCKCYKQLVSSFLICSGMCENPTDIKMLDSGICIAKRKVCHCNSELKKEGEVSNGVEDCRYWCDKMALAGLAWCAKAFKSWKCQSLCILAVDLLKDGCHWCCNEGSFYKKCIKPFEDIVKQMDKLQDEHCDPYWD